MRRTLVMIRALTVLVLLLGVGSVLFGIYHAILFPLDYGNQQALAHAKSCSAARTPDCVKTARATVVQVVNDGGNEGTLTVQVGQRQITVTAVQSYNTMAGLYGAEQIMLRQWRGHYVRVTTPAGSFDTTDNPNYAVYLDIGFGIGGTLIGAFIIWMFGRMALSPIFLALGWRRLATSDDRALDDLHHGIIPAEPVANEGALTRWMMRYQGWDSSHPLLSTLLFMALMVAGAAARILGSGGGWGSVSAFSANPRWPLILGLAAGLGLLVSLVSRRRMRQTTAELRQTGQLQQRLTEVSAWPDGQAKRAALMEIMGSLEAMAGRGRPH